MATPAFQIQTTSITVTRNTPGSATVLTKDSSGNAVDVSTGYTLGTMNVAPSANQNSAFADVSIGASMTATFGTTGVTLSWTAAQANTIAGLLPVTNCNYGLSISNDAGTTKSLIGLGLLSLANPSALG